MKPSSLLSLGAIATVFVFGIGYLTFGVVRVDWFQHYISSAMTLSNSGGLVARSPVLLSGVRAGEVTSVRDTVAGVRVDFRVNADYHIPVASSVVIENLSALGEPYIEFLPARPGGPYLVDGQQIRAEEIRTPLSIPDMAGAVTELLDQLDPQVINSLVGTVHQAMSGTDTVIPELARSTRLLAATMLSRTAAVRTILTNAQRIVGDLGGVGPALAEGGPMMGDLGKVVHSMVDTIERLMVQGKFPQDYVDGNALLPFLDRLTKLIERAGPDLQTLVPALQPLAAEATGALQQMDVSALISQALHATADDGALHLRIGVK
ncbi:MlaD family protein [Nocardia sp. NPDC051030]|uniref:MlaD family protein n=1 Tax=Nocardia sp. NPDC051030 TaxID=3155162 RepID=UPI00341DFDBD